MRVKSLLTLCIALVICACSGTSKEDQALYDKAYEKQKEIIAILGEIENELETSTLAAKDSLEEVVEELEESLIEIPGHHLELPGHEGHDHSHGRVELSAQAIYDAHADMLEQIKEIQNTLKN